MYIVNLDMSAATWLDDTEKERALRFRRPEDARRYAAAHSALRELLASCLDIEPGEIKYSRGPYGKPMLPPDIGRGLRFNISHSGDIAAIAIADHVDLGIDIERIREDVPVKEIMPLVLSPSEIEDSGEKPPDIRAFFRTWARKEAYLKARGEGLSGQMRLVPPFEKGVSMFDIDVAPGYAGALAAMGEVCLARTCWY